MVDGLHDDDGVIDHNTDGQYQCKHGKHIDGKTEELQEEKRSDERHGDGNGRYQCRPEVLQEDKYDDEYQYHRFEDGVFHLVDGFIDLVAYAIRYLVVHMVGEAGR